MNWLHFLLILAAFALEIEASGDQEFDLIINATSSGIDGHVPAILLT